MTSQDCTQDEVTIYAVQGDGEIRVQLHLGHAEVPVNKLIDRGVKVSLVSDDTAALLPDVQPQRPK